MRRRDFLKGLAVACGVAAVPALAPELTDTEAMEIAVGDAIQHNGLLVSVDKITVIGTTWVCSSPGSPGTWTAHGRLA